MAKPSFDALLKAVVAAYQNADRSASVSAIATGRAAHRAIRHRVLAVDAKSRRDSRAETIGTICSELLRGGLKVTSSNINRSVRVHAVAMSYGQAEAKQLPLQTLIAFAGTVKRDSSKEQWNIRPKVAEQARQLWQQVVAGEVQPSQVRVAVDALLGIERKPRTPKPVPTPAAKFAAIVKSTDNLVGLLQEMRTADVEAFQVLLTSLKELSAATRSGGMFRRDAA